MNTPKSPTTQDDTTTTGETPAMVNYLFISDNHDMWVAKAPAGQEPDPTLWRFQGVSDETIAELKSNGWKLTDEVSDALRELPYIEL